MVQEDILGGIPHTIHRYAKANNKYINDNNENREHLYPKYWDINA